jgi:hypothetical protein
MRMSVLLALSFVTLLVGLLLPAIAPSQGIKALDAAIVARTGVPDDVIECPAPPPPVVVELTEEATWISEAGSSMRRPVSDRQLTERLVRLKRSRPERVVLYIRAGDTRVWEDVVRVTDVAIGHGFLPALDVRVDGDAYVDGTWREPSANYIHRNFRPLKRRT